MRSIMVNNISQEGPLAWLGDVIGSISSYGKSLILALGPAMIPFFLGLLAFWIQQRWSENRKKKKHETQEINLNIMRLTDVKTVLLIFKGQFIKSLYDSGVELKKSLDESVKKGDQEIPNWYDLVGNQENYQVFRKIIPKQHIVRTVYSKELSFIARSHPQYLLSLSRVEGFISEIDELIDKYNDVLSKHIAQYGPPPRTAQSILVTHHLLFSAVEGLNFRVDDTLWFIQYSIELLEKYAQENSLVINDLSTTVKSKYDDLMPPSDLFQDFRNMVESIQTDSK